MKYNSFTLSVYVTQGDMMRLFSGEATAEKELAAVERYARVSKVYLEYFRSEFTPLPILRKARDFFLARGYEVSTGIMAVSTRFETFGRTLCYTDPRVISGFREGFAAMASEFDNIMIDDALFTSCTCERCRKMKGERSWSEFRTALMTDFCRDNIIAPAKAANPNVKITLKYPTWHESFHTVGYCTETQPLMFDEIYSGTETRHTTYSLFRNPRYTSYTLLKYLSSLPPHNNRGGWFDPIQCGGSVDNYLEQAELTLLADPREITLFCWGLVQGTKELAALGVLLDRLDSLYPKLGASAGIPVYLPHASSGEDHVYDFLGMCGVPLTPVVEFPSQPVMTLLTAASACDPDIAEKTRAHLLAGGQICVTAGFLEKTQDRGFDEFTAMRVTSGTQSSDEFGGFDDGWSADTAYYRAPHPISMPVIDWKTNECEFEAMQMRDGMPNVLLARSWYAGSKVCVLNVPGSFSDYYDIPSQVMGYIRKYLSFSLPVRLEGQSKIALFPRDNDSAVLRSFLPHGSVSMLRVRGAEKLTDLETGASIAPYARDGGESVFRIPLEPNSLKAFSWR